MRTSRSCRRSARKTRGRFHLRPRNGWSSIADAGFAGVRMEPHGLSLDISAGGGLEAGVQTAAEIGPANRALEGAARK